MPTIFITAPADSAANIASTLVEERLAACVNRVPCHSIYRWEGEVRETEETLLLAKTTGDRCAEVRERVQALHPHDVPCIERFDETDVVPAFAAWRDRATDPA